MNFNSDPSFEHDMSFQQSEGDYQDDDDFQSDESQQSQIEVFNLEVENEQDEFIDQSRVYNREEVSSFLEELSCSICCHIVIDPRTCQMCEAIFCQRCIQEWFNRKSKKICPCCRATPTDFQLCPYTYYSRTNQCIMSQKIPKLLRSLLAKLLLKCKNEGCEEIVTYEFREKHESQYCQYTIIECSNDGCELNVLRKDHKDHQDECQYAQVVCRYCSQFYARYEIDIHLGECEHRLVSCKWCRDKYEWIQLDEHEEDCELRKVVCEYCNLEFYLEESKQHTPLGCLKQQLDQAKLQLSLANQDKHQLQQRNKILTSENKQLIHEKNMFRLEAEKYKSMYQQQTSTTSDEYDSDFEEEIAEEIVIEEDKTQEVVHDWLLSLITHSDEFNQK